MARAEFLTAVASIMVFGAAHAAMVHIGSVDVGKRPSLGTSFSDFGAPVRNLRFIAQNNDVYCRSIRVQYENGSADQVFSGRLRRDQPVNADVPGQTSIVNTLKFDCHSDGRPQASIDVSADIPGFRSRLGGGRLAPGAHRNSSGRARSRGWHAIGQAQFHGRNDRETARAEQGVREVGRIALMPTDGDAACMHVSATFESGHTRDLVLIRGDVLRRGRLTVFDLPDGETNVYSVHMRCSAVDRHHVTIKVLARK